MHILHRKIKADALRALSGNWGKAIASTLLFGSICAFFFLLGKFFAKLLDLSSTMDLLHITTELRSENFLSEFLAVFLVLFEIIAIFVIAVPIFMGILRWYSHTVLCGCEEITTIFYYFSKPKLFFKSLLLVLNIVCRKVFWGLICLTPGGLVAGISLYIISLNSDGQNLFFAKLCIFVGTVLFLAGMIVFWLIGLRYSLACYLMIKEETLSVTRCIRLSRQYTLKSRGDLFRFSLSFLPFFYCQLFPISHPICPALLSDVLFHLRSVFNRTKSKIPGFPNGIHWNSQAGKKGETDRLFFLAIKKPPEKHCFSGGFLVVFHLTVQAESFHQ